MELRNIFAAISTLLAIFTTFPYVVSILKKETKPHQLSWLVFFIMNGIVFLSQYLAGGRSSVLISLTFFIGSFIIFLLSFKYGVRHSSKFDKSLFLFALGTIVVWVLTKNNDLAIWLTVLIDICATTMMVLKINAQPNSEAPFPWAVGAVAYVFTCLTLIGQPFGILYVRPFYGLFIDAALVAFILWRKSVVTKTLKSSKTAETPILE